MRTSFQTGSSLTSRAVSSQVLSAYGCLTSVFGMGTGGPPSHRRRIQLDQISICFVVSARRSLRLRLRAFRLAYENFLCAVFRIHSCILKTKQEKGALGIFRNVKCFALCIMQPKLFFAFRLDSLSLPKKSGPRRISAGPLHALRRSHSLPINLVVFEAPYYLAIWEASSQGGLHA